MAASLGGDEAAVAAWVAESPEVQLQARLASGGKLTTTTTGPRRAVSIALAVVCGVLLAGVAFAAVPIGRCLTKPRTAVLVGAFSSLLAAGLAAGVGGFAAGACS